MEYLKNKLLILFFFLIAGCSSIPTNTANSCSIFNERYLWYKHTKKVEQKWGTPIYIQLAIIKMESDFDWLAKPPRHKIFKVIPYKRPSSSLGYSQAVKKTWELYKTETNNPLALRTSFKDSAMFIGWYVNKTKKINKIPLKDTYRQYLNYYLGWGNYSKGAHKKDKKAIILAKNVEKQSKIYKKQLTECQKSLDRKKYIIF